MTTIRARFTLQLLLCLSVLAPTQSAVIFWDIGYTLAAPSFSVAFSHLGYWTTIRNMLSFTGFKVWRIFEFKNYMQNLYLDGLRQIHSAVSDHHDFHILLPDGKQMPEILQDFMVGAITSTQALACITTWADQHAGYFASPHHKNLFVRMAEFNFSIDLFIKSLQPLACAKLLKQCAESCDEDGKRTHVCIIVSNFACEHIEPFKEKFKDAIMPYIDACVFSCDGYGPKPCASFYEHCNELVRTQFPEHYSEPWLFVDDQQENLDGACQYIGHELICALPGNAWRTLVDNHII